MPLGSRPDATGVYVSGYTDGQFLGQTAFGNFDSFVRKYDFAGNELWTNQFGTNNVDPANGLVADGSSLYVVGATFGTFPGETNLGGYDAYIRKYAADGTVLWTHQFGTAQWDFLAGVAVDGSDFYVFGQTGGLLGQASSGGDDAFVGKYDSDGNELWTDQFGTAGHEVAQWMTTDGSGVIVVGTTESTLLGQTSAGGIDAFVRKYDSAGVETWTKQFGTSSNDYALWCGSWSCWSLCCWRYAWYVCGPNQFRRARQLCRQVGERCQRTAYDVSREL